MKDRSNPLALPPSRFAGSPNGVGRGGLLGLLLLLLLDELPFPLEVGLLGLLGGVRILHPGKASLVSMRSSLTNRQRERERDSLLVELLLLVRHHDAPEVLLLPSRSRRLALLSFSRRRGRRDLASFDRLLGCLGERGLKLFHGRAELLGLEFGGVDEELVRGVKRGSRKRWRVGRGGGTLHGVVLVLAVLALRVVLLNGLLSSSAVLSLSTSVPRVARERSPTIALAKGTQMRREDFAWSVLFRRKEPSLVGAVDGPLRLDKRPLVLPSTGLSSAALGPDELARGKCRSVNDDVRDGRVRRVREVGSGSKSSGIPPDTGGAEGAEDKLKRLAGDLARDVEGVRGEEGGGGRSGGRGGEGGERRKSGGGGILVGRLRRLNDEVLGRVLLNGSGCGHSSSGVDLHLVSSSARSLDGLDALLDVPAGDLLLLASVECGSRGDLLGGCRLGLFSKDKRAVPSASLVLLLVKRGRVDKVDIGVELEEDEAEDRLVELEEGEKDAEVDVRGDLKSGEAALEYACGK